MPPVGRAAASACTTAAASCRHAGRRAGEPLTAARACVRVCEQGLLPFYYVHYHSPKNDFARVDHCVFNTLGGRGDCKDRHPERALVGHFTDCQKPWCAALSCRAWRSPARSHRFCYPYNDKEHAATCLRMHNEWWARRAAVRKLLGLPFV